MKTILGFLKAVFNFVVGDWILLVGVIVVFGGTAAVFFAGSFLDSWLGPLVFVLALIFVLALSLALETRKR